MRRLILAVIVLLALPLWLTAAPPSPYSVTIDVQRANAPDLRVYQANQRTIRLHMQDGGSAINAASSTVAVSWSTSARASGIVTASVAAVNSGTGGVFDATWTAASLNTNGTMIYEVLLTDPAGAVVTYKQGRLYILPSPAASGAGAVVFGTNINWATVARYLAISTHGPYRAGANVTFTTNADGSVNIVGSVDGTGATNAVGTGRLTLGYDSAGATVTGAVDVSGLATGTPLYVESDATALGALGVASSALNTAIGYVSGFSATAQLTAVAASNLAQSAYNGLAGKADATNVFVRDAYNNAPLRLGDTNALVYPAIYLDSNTDHAWIKIDNSGELELYSSMDIQFAATLDFGSVDSFGVRYESANEDSLISRRWANSNLDERVTGSGGIVVTTNSTPDGTTYDIDGSSIGGGGTPTSLRVLSVTNLYGATASAHNYITFDVVNGVAAATNAWSYSATGTAVLVGSAAYTFAPGVDATTTWYIWRDGFATNVPDARCANILMRRAVPSGSTAASYQFSETFPVLSTAEVFRITILPAVGMTNAYLQDNSIIRNLYFELSTWIQEP